MGKYEEIRNFGFFPSPNIYTLDEEDAKKEDMSTLISQSVQTQTIAYKSPTSRQSRSVYYPLI